MSHTVNKYSDKKIVWFSEKLNSFKNNIITAPLYVRVKPLNACNHHCFWCVYHSDLTNMHGEFKSKDILPKDKFREVLKDFKDMGVKAVTYSGGGEPLLYPGIEEFLSLTLDLGIDLSIITHGQFIEKEKAKYLSCAKWVRVSIDYYNGESLLATRNVNPKYFDVIMNNIGEFAELKNKDCDLEVNFIITKNNYKFLEIITRKLKNLKIDNIRFSPMWCDTFHEYHNPIKNEVYETIKTLSKELETSKFKIYSSYSQVENLNISKREYKKCYINQTVPVVGADQVVYVCHNQAYALDSNIGSIKDKSFKDLWFSQETKDFFNNFDCQKTCTGQCAADSKNKFITELLEAQGDNFV